ncbi:MAG: peptidoglycan synthetase FtsI [Actinomycetota bacterium]
MSVVAGGRGGRVSTTRVQPRQKARNQESKQARRRPNAADVVRDHARNSVTDFYTNLQGGKIRFRLVAMYVLVSLLLMTMLVRVSYLQTIGAGDYRDASVSQRTRISTAFAERGSILDRNGLELALPVPTRTVFADPRIIVDPVATAHAIAGVLGMSPEDELVLASKLQNTGSSFLYIARQATTEVADALTALNLAGISSYSEESRTLTSDGLRALVGRTDIDGIGISGLEAQFDDLLGGTDGRTVREVNSKGQSIPTGDDSSQAAVPGQDLVTTIDRNIQFQVDAIMTQQITRLNARGGAAIVMDSMTGEIYAMSTIRKNADGTYTADSGNFAAVDAYEPGSVAKVFSVSAALNEGTVQTNSVFKVPGTYIFNQGTKWAQPVSDAFPHELEDMTVRKIIVDSSNLGTVQIAQTMLAKTLRDYLALFGFGTKTDVDYPGESKGLLKSFNELLGTEKITTAYGYGYSSSALQLIAGVNVVANNGVYVAPRLVSSVIDLNGINQPSAPSATHRVIKPEVAATMRSLMGDVVCFGTASLAKVPGMTVAGKTGTGYKRQDNGTYVKDDGSRAYFASFVGFLPAENPRFTVLVSIDEPDPASRDRFGGTAAAPVFANIAQVLINELDIRPAATDMGCPKQRPVELGPAH